MENTKPFTVLCSENSDGLCELALAPEESDVVSFLETNFRHICQLGDFVLASFLDRSEKLDIWGNISIWPKQPHDAADAWDYPFFPLSAMLRPLFEDEFSAILLRFSESRSKAINQLNKYAPDILNLVEQSTVYVRRAPEAIPLADRIDAHMSMRTCETQSHRLRCSISESLLSFDHTFNTIEHTLENLKAVSLQNIYEPLAQYIRDCYNRISHQLVEVTRRCESMEDIVEFLTSAERIFLEQDEIETNVRNCYTYFAVVSDDGLVLEDDAMAYLNNLSSLQTRLNGLVREIASGRFNLVKSALNEVEQICFNYKHNVKMCMKSNFHSK